jgi:flagellar biosynthesis protein FlhG
MEDKIFQLEKYSQDEIKEIKRACCHVFMNEKAMHSVAVSENNQTRLSYPFLEQLTYADVKQAYRSNMFTYHPDRHQDKESEDIDIYSRHVEGVNRSYEYLSALFGGKKAGYLPASARRSHIIAVGGAKGGIGKSIFAANLGMMLSSLGFKTIMVDMDLGGSNLHIYLGHKQIPEITLNDFLNRKVAFLKDAAVGCKQGPMLIAGNSGTLGAANISFQTKMRLIENIRKLNVDYVILDLGGGTDFNTLDFFLASDLGIVLTTLDQSAYLEAYAFIKTALQRKLNRLFSADSSFPAQRNAALKEIVVEGTHGSEKGHPRTIQALLERVANTDPVSLPLIADEILNFSPRLVINHCFDHHAARRVASTLRFVACQRLSIDIKYVGTISKHRIIEQSTSYAHHPLVARKHTDMFIAEMESIIGALSLAN